MGNSIFPPGNSLRASKDSETTSHLMHVFYQNSREKFIFFALLQLSLHRSPLGLRLQDIRASLQNRQARFCVRFAWFGTCAAHRSRTNGVGCGQAAGSGLGRIFRTRVRTATRWDWVRSGRGGLGRFLHPRLDRYLVRLKAPIQTEPRTICDTAAQA